MRITLSADDKASDRKKDRTSVGAVGWFITLLYVESRVWVTKISTYGGRECAINISQTPFLMTVGTAYTQLR